MALTSGALRGSGAASIASITVCRISDGKVCHSSLKASHFLSIAGNQGGSFPYIREQQHIQQIFHMAHALQGCHKKRVEVLVRRFGGIVLFPAAQKIVVAGQYPEAVTLHALKLLLRAFLPGFPPGAAPCPHRR